ncbi:hypothetical protein NEMIN01_0756 [Nematocida minor]|uniref:uncharacterized protein n=1 Tax=Nematocida minor TaxID=1912983 RepID=UPI00221FADBD|nr:uncharacterized protein NEMIN01_0756 [Nematocida minor]KAI5189893.1 hypothetical protein NEMIN01_0756 [Nematocida minor]
MSEIENSIEILQETDSADDIEQFLANNLEEIIDYVQLASYKEGQKSRKLGTLDFIKGAFSNRSIANRLCTEKYIFGLRNIRKNSHAKKVPDGVAFVCYEIYTETIKMLLDFMPEQVISIIYKHPSLCYFEQLIKSADCNSIVEMFPCFFSLNGAHFERWIQLLTSKSIVSMIFKYFNRPGKPHKDIQNLSKLLYLFVSFTGTVFRDSASMESMGIHYTYFYREIEKRTHPLLDTIFLGTDSINRISCLEVIREMIRTTEFLPADTSVFSFLYRYLTHSEILKEFSKNSHEPHTVVRVIYLINTIAATIRFKSVHTLSFLKSSSFLAHTAMYLHTTTTHTVTNEICALINELIYVDKIFYMEPIIELCQAVKSHTFKRAIQLYSTSQKRHSPHVSVSDCITPVIYILYKLYYICHYESTSRSREAKTLSKRFIVVDETTDSYKILQQLEFLQDESAYWYITTRVVEHERRLSLEYCRALPERQPNAEQFARYFCEYTASVLPAYPPWLFQ